LGDHLNTIRDIINSDGTVADHLDYNSFGKLISVTKNTDQIFFAYTGKLTDKISELQWNINRWYDSNVGRWVSEDPIGFDNTLNLFQYVGNTTTSYVDLHGLRLFRLGGNKTWEAVFPVADVELKFRYQFRNFRVSTSTKTICCPPRFPFFNKEFGYEHTLILSGQIKITATVNKIWSIDANIPGIGGAYIRATVGMRGGVTINFNNTQVSYTTCNNRTGVNIISDYEASLAVYGSVGAGLYTALTQLGSVTASVTGILVVQGSASLSLSYYYDDQGIEYGISFSQPTLVRNKTGLYASFDIQYGNQRYNRTTNFLAQ
ncbi:MAG: RHS repeat-associated core domain-containing protein, partial [Planctomycetaceae bacterium]|nr:RHS repeat-associated core domain-containing protein [Planctomycetaceae bacterium]